MATIRVERTVGVPASRVWEALSDFGALHTRLAPGFVVDTVVEGDIRIVTFANGMVVRERLLGLAPVNRRIAYTIMGAPFEHHSASNTVIENGPDECRFVWIADLLPDALAPQIEAMMNAGSDAMLAVMQARD